MKITRRITEAISWRHAAGEILLIFIGVVIALQASDWWDRKAERRLETAYLVELQSDLQQDRQKVAEALDRHKKIEATVSELLEYLRSDQPYTDELDASFGVLYGVKAFEVNSAAYESLKSHGVTLISNPELRPHIARVFEDTYARVQRSVLYEGQAIMDLLRPYFLVNFRDLRFNISATPIDYDAIANDPEFINLVSYRLQLSIQNQIPTFTRSLDEIDALTAAIDEELKGR